MEDGLDYTAREEGVAVMLMEVEVVEVVEVEYSPEAQRLMRVYKRFVVVGAVGVNCH